VDGCCAITGAGRVGAPAGWGTAFFTDRIALATGGWAEAAGLEERTRAARMRAASSSLIELLWLRTTIDSFSAASRTSLLSSPRSRDSS
jgi:hypothetical protein